VIGGQLASPHTPFPPNASAENFEIAILLKIAQRPDHNIFVLTQLPRARGQAL